jgi:hypothetical protein
MLTMITQKGKQGYGKYKASQSLGLSNVMRDIES